MPKNCCSRSTRSRRSAKETPPKRPKKADPTSTTFSPKKRPRNDLPIAPAEKFHTPCKRRKRQSISACAAPSPSILRTPGYSASGNAVNWTPQKTKLDFNKNSPPVSVSKKAAHTSHEELRLFVECIDDRGNHTQPKKLALLATVTESDSYETLPDTFICWPLDNKPVMLGSRKTQEYLYRHISLSSDRGVAEEHGRFDLRRPTDDSEGDPFVTFTDLGRNTVSLLNGEPLEHRVARRLRDGDLLKCSGTTLKVTFVMVIPIQLTEEDVADFEIQWLKKHLACRGLDVCGAEAKLRKRLLEAVKRE